VQDCHNALSTFRVTSNKKYEESPGPIQFQELLRDSSRKIHWNQEKEISEALEGN